MPIYELFQILSIKTYVLYALKKRLMETLLLHTNNICLIGKKRANNLFGGYIYLCFPPFHSNFRYFEIKFLVPRTSNFRDSTVSYVKRFRALNLKKNTHEPIRLNNKMNMLEL